MKQTVTLALILALFLTVFAPGCLSDDDDGATGPISAEMEYSSQYPLAFYNTFAYREEPDCIYSVRNNGNESISIRMTSVFDGYSSPAVTTVELVPDEEAEVPQTLIIRPETIGNVTTPTRMNLHMTVEYETPGGWHVYDEQTAPIDLFPADTMVYEITDTDGEEIYLYEYLPVFVTPASPSVRELVSTAKEYAISENDPRYAEFDMIRSLPGYQCGDDCTPEQKAAYADIQVEAIYNALKEEYQISYLNLDSSFESMGYVQRISTPDVSLGLHSANCIDGAVLFASALEAITMRPYIVLIPGHAYVAWATTADGDEIHALETTMISTNTFEEALAAGQEEFEENWDDLEGSDGSNEYYLVDVKAARDVEIYPVK